MSLSSGMRAKAGNSSFWAWGAAVWPGPGARKKDITTELVLCSRVPLAASGSTGRCPDRFLSKNNFEIASGRILATCLRHRYSLRFQHIEAHLGVTGRTTCPQWHLLNPSNQLGGHLNSKMLPKVTQSVPKEFKMVPEGYQNGDPRCQHRPHIMDNGSRNCTNNFQWGASL